MKVGLRDALKMFEALVYGFEIIDSLSGSNPVTISRVVQALRDGIQGKTSPELVLSELRALQDQIAANDAAIKARLDEKFPFDVTDEGDPVK